MLFHDEVYTYAARKSWKLIAENWIKDKGKSGNFCNEYTVYEIQCKFLIISIKSKIRQRRGASPPKLY